MDNVIFRGKQEIKKEERNENLVPEKQVTTSIVKPEVPYSDYLAENGRPYLTFHYSLGDGWEIFNSELGLLEDYLDRKINSGEIANSVPAVKNVLKKMEKLNGLTDEERSVVKLGIIASYIKFLNEADGVRQNSRKYGTH
jgi:hypothetical protein